jgi:hypothetical protein
VPVAAFTKRAYDNVWHRQLMANNRSIILHAPSCMSAAVLPLHSSKVGTGVQLAVAVASLLLLAALGAFGPANRGAMTTCGLVLLALAACPGARVAAQLWRRYNRAGESAVDGLLLMGIVALESSPWCRCVCQHVGFLTKAHAAAGLTASCIWWCGCMSA